MSSMHKCMLCLQKCFFFLSSLQRLTIKTMSNVGIYVLKTLLNIVEAPFKKLLNFDVCVV